jgi:Fe2+ or Zn2+ uptake regulation protein
LAALLRLLNQQVTVGMWDAPSNRGMERLGQSERRGRDATWEMALKILHYLAENTNAADTAEGILQWWLLDRTIIEEEEAVGQALDLLVEQNLIVAVQTADSRRHYRLNAEKIEETRNLIREEETEKRRA